MTISRRRFIAGGSAAAAAALAPTLGDADRARFAARPQVAWAAGRSQAMPPPPPEVHLLNRASFGPTPAERARVRAIGLEAWIEEQLAPESIDDGAVEDALEPLASLGWSGAEIRANAGKRPMRNELVAATLYRAVYSRRQLYEVMVDHWSNQLNVFHLEEFINAAKTLDDREVIRKHAMGSFRAMIQASARSAAMMRYLDTVRNTAQGPNENYAREVMELHTLGVDGGYTEADVKTLARCLTGWAYNNNTLEFQFNEANHDNGPKTLLGQAIAARGVEAGREALDRLIDHPSCARHVARRLVQRFVSDDPPADLVAQVAAAFGRDGDIRAMLGVLLRAPAFHQAVAAPDLGPAKLRRPLELWVAALRATEANAAFLLNVPPEQYIDMPSDGDYADRPERYLQIMDQVPFRWRAPDGYPEPGRRWSGMHVIVGRWNFALALMEGRLEGLRLDPYAETLNAGLPLDPAAMVDYWSDRILGRSMLPQDRMRLVEFLSRGRSGLLSPELARERLPMTLALLLDSPYIMRR